MLVRNVIFGLFLISSVLGGWGFLGNRALRNWSVSTTATTATTATTKENSGEIVPYLKKGNYTAPQAPSVSK